VTEQPEQNSNLENLAFLLASFTDNGRSLRAFTANPQELAITIITAGLLANTKLMISPEDAVKSAFDIHARIQRHVANYQSMQFAANIENCFGERHPEVDGD
jgi:lauroyl/myristoyl acyltransferase